MPRGRDIASVINSLIALPFALVVATKDYHPEGHISFCTSHSPPDNKPITCNVRIKNPENPEHSLETTLWPEHCIQGTPGADIIPEINASKIDITVEKGRDQRVESYSGFADMFGNKSSENFSLDLASLLKEKAITDVFVVGLTGDCCVKCTAIDAKKEGFVVHVVREGTRSVDEGEAGWGAAVKEFEQVGVRVVQLEGEEVARVKSLSNAAT